MTKTLATPDSPSWTVRVEFELGVGNRVGDSVGKGEGAVDGETDGADEGLGPGVSPNAVSQSVGEPVATYGSKSVLILPLQFLLFPPPPGA